LIPPETISQVIDTADIVEVIGEFVKLKRSGASYKGLSPFNNEKTPSFYVHPGKGIFKDFSSGKGGNVVSFLMEIEHFTYPEAIKWLAKRYNIEIEEKERTPDEVLAQNEKESLFIVNVFAEKYFAENMHETDEGKSIGLSYFKERAFSTDIIKHFKLGYSPEQSQAFYQAAKKNGFTDEILEKAGLVKSKSPHYYDAYKGRVIFPIHNLTGRPIAFAGRTLLSDKKVPKYINSPETPIYHKSDVLYGLFFAKNDIIKEDNCFLVEGYTDVISLYQAGIKNTVASSGTSLTQGQIRLIKRYTQNISILYDGDLAGIKASFRGIDLILEEGLNVKVLLFPNGEDPDSFAKNNSSDEVKEYIAKNLKDFISFKIDFYKEEINNDPLQKSKVVREVLQSLSLIPDAITRSVYAQECSRKLDMEERVLFNELNKLRNKILIDKAKSEEKAPIEIDLNSLPPSPNEIQEAEEITNLVYEFEEHEKEIIRLLLHYKDNEIIFYENDDNGKKEEHTVNVAHYIVHELQNDTIEFENPVYKKVIEVFTKAIEAEEQVDKNYFIHHEDMDVRSIAAEILTDKYSLSENWKKSNIIILLEEERLKESVINALLHYKLKIVRKLINEIPIEIHKAEQNKEDITPILYKKISLDDLKKRISNELGNVVLKYL
jgi:DNA primase